jgi:hypothetical protein
LASHMRHGKCFKYAKLAIFADQKAALMQKEKIKWIVKQQKGLAKHSLELVGTNKSIYIVKKNELNDAWVGRFCLCYACQICSDRYIRANKEADS